MFVYGIDQGFRVVVPADSIIRTLNLYVGLYGAEGKVQAYLSDFSAPAFTDVSLNNPWANSYARYTLQYAAASPGQTLTVDFIARTLHDQDFGNVSLQAATLQGAMRPQIYDPEHGGNSFAFSFLTEASRAYTVQFTDSLSPFNWQTLTNLSGDGNPVRVFDPNPAQDQRFYRIVAQ